MIKLNRLQLDEHLASLCAGCASQPTLNSSNSGGQLIFYYR